MSYKQELVFQFSSVPDFYYSLSLFFQQVSKLGFGCMGLTGVYNSPLSEEEVISIIKDAFAKGITFFDTADAYAAHTNEVLVGKVSISVWELEDRCLEQLHLEYFVSNC